MNCVLILAVLLIALVGAGGASGSERFVPAVAGPSWTIAYSPSMPATLSGEEGGYYFDFPTSTDGVHYVIRRAPSVQMGQTVTIRFALEGNGRLLAAENGAQGQVRLFLQRVNDRLTGNEPYKRWWSVALVNLVSPGEYTLSVKIEPRAWLSVWGATGDTVPAEFAECMANLANVGFTFGGGNHAGHGVYVANRSVRFVLKQYSVR